MKTLKALLPILAIVSLPTCIFAQQITLTGKTTYVPVSTEITELADGHTITRSIITGISTADNPDDLFNKASVHCSGTEDSRTGINSGYCDSFDSDGDIWWIWWKTEGDGSTWGLLGGTGKYQGAKGSGTARVVDSWADGKYILLWDLTYELK